MLITTLFNVLAALLSNTSQARAMTFDEATKSHTLVGTQVISKTLPDGIVKKAGIPWTETACQEIVLKRADDGYHAANLIEKDEIYSAERIELNEKVLGEKLIARRIQYCFAKSSQIE